MKRAGFTMQLKPGNAGEYKRRHDEIWSELVAQLRSAGVRDYAIYLDPSTDTLYASWKLTEPNDAETLAEKEVVRRWWNYMADIMETNADDSPTVGELHEMFYMD